MPVGAIQTTTRYSLPYSKQIVHAYHELGFDSIFVRPLTPLGKANRSWSAIGYSTAEFIEFYQNILQEILQLNKSGIRMKEVFASLMLQKSAGCGVNYMELRSPCGAGIGQLAYFADGRVFTCDEGRMLSEMGDDAFLLGDVYHDTYDSLIKSSGCRTVCSSSIMESIPSCCDCVYLPYCGVCPVVNYALYDDVIEKEPRSYKCRIQSGILDCLFKILQHDGPEAAILKDWGEN